MMTKLKTLFLSAALVAGVAGIAAAQPSAETKADRKELREAKRAEMLSRFDTNKDGKLDAQEKAAMR